MAGYSTGCPITSTSQKRRPCSVVSISCSTCITLDSGTMLTSSFSPPTTRPGRLHSCLLAKWQIIPIMKPIFQTKSVAVHAPLMHNYWETECGRGGVGGLGGNPFKLNHKFNDKSQAKVNRAAQLQLFEILTPSANHLSEWTQSGF